MVVGTRAAVTHDRYLHDNVNHRCSSNFVDNCFVACISSYLRLYILLNKIVCLYEPKMGLTCVLMPIRSLELGFIH